MSALKKGLTLVAASAALLAGGVMATTANAADVPNWTAFEQMGKQQAQEIKNSAESISAQKQDTLYFDVVQEYSGARYAVVTGYHNYPGDNNTMTIPGTVTDQDRHTSLKVKYVGYGDKSLSATNDSNQDQSAQLKTVKFTDDFQGTISPMAFKERFTNLQTIDLSGMTGGTIAAASFPFNKNVTNIELNTDPAEKITVGDAAFYQTGVKANSKVVTLDRSKYDMQGALCFQESMLAINWK